MGYVTEHRAFTDAPFDATIVVWKHHHESHVGARGASE